MTMHVNPLTRRQALGLFGTSLVAGCMRDDSFSGPPDWTVEDGPAAVTTRQETPPAEGTWPMAKRDPAGTASAPAENGPSSLPLDRRWTYSTGPHESRARMWTPAVASGVLLAQLANPTPTKLAALDPATGEEQWAVAADKLGASSPAMGAETGFVTHAGHDVEHTVRAVGLADGTTSWRVTGVDFPRTDPVLVGDTLYGGAGDTGTATVFALQAESGAWGFKLTFSAPAIGIRRLAVVDGTVFVATMTTQTHSPEVDYITAFEPATSEVRWQYQAQDTINDLAVRRGKVFATIGNTLVALSTSDGTVLWSDQDFDTDARTIAATDQTVWVGAHRQVRAFESETGDERWVGHFGGSNALVQAGKHVFAVGRTPDEASKWGVAALDADDGRTRWRYDAAVQPWSASVAAGAVYVGTVDGRVLAFAERGATPST